MSGEQDEDKPFVIRVGGIDIDYAKSLGFYGGIGMAVAFGIVAPELAAFVALVPLLKLFKRKNAGIAEKFGAAVLEGAAKPLGGDAEEVVRPAWEDDQEAERSSPVRAR
jgi:hypothetical protein